MTLIKLKIMLIGDSNVGKTCAIHRFCNETYYLHQITIACDIKLKTLHLDGDNVQLEIWDTIGAEQYRAVSPINYRNVKGFLLMYDVSNLDSFRSLKKWIEDIDDAVPTNIKILVGNKCDVPDEKREVNFQTGLQLANELNVPFYEVSCKENINISEPFVMLAKKIKQQLIIDTYEERIKLLEAEIKKKNEDKCCIII